MAKKISDWRGIRETTKPVVREPDYWVIFLAFIHFRNCKSALIVLPKELETNEEAVIRATKLGWLMEGKPVCDPAWANEELNWLHDKNVH